MNRGLAILTIVLLIGAAGCTKFPYGASFDRHNFLSTPSRPLTVSIEDALTREELVRIDVPIGKKVVIDFDHEIDWSAGPSSAMPAEEVRWEVFPPNKKMSGPLRNKMVLSGNPVRMKVTVREPQSMEDLTEPDYQPSEGGGEARPSERGPRYQPADEPREGEGDEDAGPADDQAEGNGGEQIAPERGPATREPVDRQPQPDETTPNDAAGGGTGDDAAAPPDASDLEDALDAGDDGPNYQPSEPVREQPDDTPSDLGASG